MSLSPGTQSRPPMCRGAAILLRKPVVEKYRRMALGQQLAHPTWPLPPLCTYEGLLPESTRPLAAAGTNCESSHWSSHGSPYMFGALILPIKPGATLLSACLGLLWMSPTSAIALQSDQKQCWGDRENNRVTHREAQVPLSSSLAAESSRGKKAVSPWRTQAPLF